MVIPLLWFPFCAGLPKMTTLPNPTVSCEESAGVGAI